MSKLKEKMQSFVTKYPTLCEFARFIIIGGCATLVDMFVMGVVLYIFNPALYPNFFNVFYGGGRPTTSASVVGTGFGFIVGLIFNYIFSILFVFNEKGESKSVKGAIIFLVLSAIGLGLHYLGMFVGFDLLGMNEWIVKIIMTVIVLFYNYLSKKFLLFRNKKNESIDCAKTDADVNVDVKPSVNANVKTSVDDEKTSAKSNTQKRKKE